MREQTGLTLTELLVVVALASMTFLATLVYSVPWVARQTMRGAAHDVQAFLQLTKIEASSRNLPCRFVIDTASGALQIWDSRGTASLLDDELLHEGRIPDSVGFARPTVGPVVTLSQIGASPSYQSVFASDGLVVAGTGDVFVGGGKHSHGRISVYGAGGVEISYWKGGAWEVVY